MARFNLAGLVSKPVEFVGEVRQEVSKVTWPKSREVWITTVLVGVMVAVASIFFLLADFVIGGGIKMLLSLGK
jgi:preprotein translocase subunit SecE